MPIESAFMPFVGHVNAVFFAEMGWVNFSIVVIPAMSVLSGLLASTLDFLQWPHWIAKP
jgi:hypothetical protein